MEQKEKETSPFTKFDHVGVVVRNLDRAIEYYDSLGMGPFEPLGTAVAQKTLRGRPFEDIRADGRIGQMGQIKLELVQPVAGESLHKEFLETRGEGINHVCFAVDDIEKETAKLANKGFKIMSTVTFVKGGGNVYFDTGEVGGMLTELLQRPPE